MQRPQHWFFLFEVSEVTFLVQRALLSPQILRARCSQFSNWGFVKRNVPASLDLYSRQKLLIVLQEHGQESHPTAVGHYVAKQVVLRAVEVEVEVEKVLHTRERP